MRYWLRHRGRRARTGRFVSFEFGVGTSDEVGADDRAAAEPPVPAMSRRSGSSPTPSGASSSCTATGSSARSRTPKTRSRRPCSRPAWPRRIRGARLATGLCKGPAKPSFLLVMACRASDLLAYGKGYGKTDGELAGPFRSDGKWQVTPLLPPSDWVVLSHRSRRPFSWERSARRSAGAGFFFSQLVIQSRSHADR